VTSSNADLALASEDVAWLGVETVGIKVGAIALAYERTTDWPTMRPEPVV
jgi:hypothetical protein